MFKLRICGFWIVLILFLFSCKRNTEKYAFYINSSENSDLSAIVANKKLVVLAENSATSYVELEGVKMGFEYELLKEYALKVLCFHSLHCSIHGDNPKSISLFEKCGFEKVGIRKDWYLEKGSRIDEILFQVCLEK